MPCSMMDADGPPGSISSMTLASAMNRFSTPLTINASSTTRRPRRRGSGSSSRPGRVRGGTDLPRTPYHSLDNTLCDHSWPQNLVQHREFVLVFPPDRFQQQPKYSSLLRRVACILPRVILQLKHSFHGMPHLLAHVVREHERALVELYADGVAGALRDCA